MMGVLNVTPDSFSDGGRFRTPEAALAHGRRLAADGADIIDVGGESTRPGAQTVPEDEERRRVVPVIAELTRLGVPISVDTQKAAVADAALRAGATIVNDVSAGRADPEMLGVVATHGAGVVLMHMRGEPRTMQQDPRYRDVVAEVGDFLAERVDAARAAGVPADRIVVDPGIGFGKTAEHSWALLRATPVLAARVPAPLLVGPSRKSFLRAVGAPDDPMGRDAATAATAVWALRHGAAMVRVHDVAGCRAALAAWARVEAAASGAGPAPGAVSRAHPPGRAGRAGRTTPAVAAGERAAGA